MGDHSNPNPNPNPNPQDRPLDRLHIQDLLVRCIVGINPEEREKEQDVIINVTLHADHQRHAPR